MPEKSNKSQENEIKTIENLVEAISDGLKHSNRVRIPVSDSITAQYILRLTLRHPVTFSNLIGKISDNHDRGTCYLYATEIDKQPMIVYSDSRSIERCPC